MPAGSKTDPPLAKAKPISTSVITYLRRKTKQLKKAFATGERSEKIAERAPAAQAAARAAGAGVGCLRYAIPVLPRPGLRGERGREGGGRSAGSGGRSFVSQFKQYVFDSNSEELEDWLINIQKWSICHWSN
ncbi:zinc finger protein 462-like [Grus japonensis]|uniref:Zinc finger protein 462-like n=1 Tax=Grus japonensis TaxID=30415 RepID=A0ABC9WKS7_GRUJA